MTSDRTSVSSRPVVRLTTPGELVASVPALCGFPPQESVVVLSLRGPRRRLGLTVRVDLPPPTARPDPVPELADLLAERVAADGGSAGALLVFSAHRRPELVAAYLQACAASGTTLDQALHVAGGRWTSYTCRGPCCPRAGARCPSCPGCWRRSRRWTDGPCWGRVRTWSGRWPLHRVRSPSCRRLGRRRRGPVAAGAAVQRDRQRPTVRRAAR
jgi:hypothetical protein